MFEISRLHSYIWADGPGPARHVRYEASRCRARPCYSLHGDSKVPQGGALATPCSAVRPTAIHALSAICCSKRPFLRLASVPDRRPEAMDGYASQNAARTHREGPRHCTDADAAAKTVTATRTAGTAGYPHTRNGPITSGRRERGRWMAPTKSSPRNDNPTEAS